MLSGCFQGYKQGIHRKINGIMKDQDCINILKVSYASSLEKIGYELGYTLFTQDNDLKHKAKERSYSKFCPQIYNNFIETVPQILSIIIKLKGCHIM